VFLQIKVDGSHLNLIRAHDGHPDRDGRRCAASRFGLRPPRLAAQRKTYTTSWDINRNREQLVEGLRPLTGMETK